MSPVITFIIPIRHPNNVRDHSEQIYILKQTLWSIAAQSDKSWECIIVANKGAPIPSLPQGFKLVNVDFPPNPHHDRRIHSSSAAYSAVRHDKGQRVLSGIVEKSSSRFVMVIDDDDLVSRRLVEFVSANADAEGWYIENGYEFWDTGRRIRSWPIDNFWKLCGSSIIFRPERLDLPHGADYETNTFVANMLGSHRFLKPEMERRGNPLEVVPFAAAAYRRGHSNSHSSSGMQRANHLWRLRVFNKGLIRTPVQNISRLKEALKSPRSFLEEYAGQ